MSRMAIYSISVYLVSVTINLPIQNASSLFHSIIFERGWQTKTVMCINGAFVMILDIYRGSTRRILIPSRMCIRVK